jgi:hypothetical protein
MRMTRGAGAGVVEGDVLGVAATVLVVLPPDALLPQPAAARPSAIAVAIPINFERGGLDVFIANFLDRATGMNQQIDRYAATDALRQQFLPMAVDRDPVGPAGY